MLSLQLCYSCPLSRKDLKSGFQFRAFYFIELLNYWKISILIFFVIDLLFYLNIKRVPFFSLCLHSQDARLANIPDITNPPHSLYFTLFRSFVVFPVLLWEDQEDFKHLASLSLSWKALWQPGIPTSEISPGCSVPNFILIWWLSFLLYYLCAMEGAATRNGQI